MKTLYLIGGTMGVGKTTVCQILKKKMDKAVFLDGDWCWDADPFLVNDETKKMAMENICFLLNNFIHCSAYDNIIFCWVMHQQEIIDQILEQLDTEACSVKIISLLCSEKMLRKRLEKDVLLGVRTEDVINRSIERIPLYKKLPTEKIDTSEITAEQVADIVRGLNKKY